MNMTNDANDIAIVHSTVELSRNLGLEVVAEGLETQAAQNQLRSLGCHYGQGYLVSPTAAPVGLTEFFRILSGLIRPPNPMSTSLVARSCTCGRAPPADQPSKLLE